MSIPLEHKPTAAPAAPGALDELRAIYTAIDTGEDQTEVFDVDGTNVAIRYRRLGVDRSREIFAGGTEAEAAPQFLIDACDEILYRDPETGDLAPILPGERVTFDFRPGESIPLHQALGIEETDIRRSVLRLFKGAERVMVLHARQVDAWMDTLRSSARETFQGG